MSEQLENIELSIEQAKRSIGEMTTLQKLTKNEDFKKVILEGYFEKEASRLVLLRAEPSMSDAESRAIIDDQITAIGFLRQHFTTIMQFGRMAERALADDEATREEILEEELKGEG